MESADDRPHSLSEYMTSFFHASPSASEVRETQESRHYQRTLHVVFDRLHYNQAIIISGFF
jgi:hypothetical protein